MVVVVVPGNPVTVKLQQKDCDVLDIPLECQRMQSPRLHCVEFQFFVVVFFCKDNNQQL